MSSLHYMTVTLNDTFYDVLVKVMNEHNYTHPTQTHTTHSFSSSNESVFTDHDGVRSGCQADAFIRDLCNRKWFQFAEQPETTPAYQLRNSPSLPPLTFARTPLSDRQSAYLPESEDEEEEELLLSS